MNISGTFSEEIMSTKARTNFQHCHKESRIFPKGMDTGTESRASQLVSLIHGWGLLYVGIRRYSTQYKVIQISSFRPPVGSVWGYSLGMPIEIGMT